MKTGPKALTGKALANKHAVRLNYKLLKVIEERKFLVECLSCSRERITIGATRVQCVCTHKRPFYTVKRTPETHTQEIHDKGLTDYTCLTVGKLSKDKNVYKHSCGYKFKMSKDCFLGCHVPCSECRPALGYTDAEFKAKLRKYSKQVVPLGTYEPCQETMLYEYVKCGHKLRLRNETFKAGKPCIRCKICYPKGIWFRFKVNGKRFQTRSRIEKLFVKWIIRKGYDVDLIEYEPKQGRVDYYNPVKSKNAYYTPDFKINNTYVEIKDLHSLGLLEYHWQPHEEALIENRAKYQAAKEQLDKYRLVVHVKGNFYTVGKFWTAKEQKRLLDLRYAT